jgi:hypothetical protein
VELRPNGRVGLTLARPWADGTQALVFTPVEFLEKLAVLIPKPRVNLLLYHGLLAPRARHRAAVLDALPAPRAPASPLATGTASAPVALSTGTSALPLASASSAIVATSSIPPPVHIGTDGPPTPPSSRPPRQYFSWAELLRRVFEIDVLACACGGRLRFIATIEEPPVVERILRHLGLPTAIPEPAPARPPPPGRALAFDFPG